MRQLLVVAGLLVALPLRAQQSSPWFATWAASAQRAPDPPRDSIDRVPTYVNRTIRQVVRTTLGGERVRIRLTNEYGERPLVIGAAHIAMRDSGAAIRRTTDRAITFGGRTAVTLQPGAVMFSDAIDLAIPALSDLAISLWVQDSIRATTRHTAAHQTSYVSAHGDYTGAAALTPDTTITAWLWLAGVDVVNASATGVIVAIGNSITDGSQTTLDANTRWPDVLARRLLASSEPPKAVVNAGIGGNRVLALGNGPSALARFDRDVLMQPGVTHIVLLEGINDITRGSPPSNPRDSVSAADIIFGYQQLIARAHERGLIIYGATLTPIGGLNRPVAEAKRRAINEWIRTSGMFDGVIDFEAATRDPAQPERMLPTFDSGDHLHPGDAGYRAMGESIDLALFRRTRQATQARAVDLRAAAALVERVVPGHGRDFSLAAIPDSAGLDVFEVAQDGRRIVLRGSSGVAIASALNWYLEHVAGVNVSLPLQPIHLASLRPVPSPVRVSTPYRLRYFFNYCTFSYSMAWWDWDQWQRMIDWMALKGINTPLAVTGQEAVWRLVLQDLGFSRDQIGSFLVGPAYLPWGWMGNIDGLGGPLPDSWIDSHITLERQILERERALGMTPVLQGFTGHVPGSITQVFPNARIHRTGDWSAGFSGTWFLDPLDSLFQRFGQRFIERQTELFGTDHLYAADPFNEINPPSNDSTFLAGMGHAIYRSMQSADPQAVWLLQGWFLYYQASFWREPQARALLGAVPDDRMVVLDLWGDRHPVWRVRQAFYGKPWVWNVLYNFGGKISVNGDLPSIARNLDSALSSPDRGRLSGLGMMMEGLGTNPIVPDFVMDQTWRDRVPAVDAWSRDYVTRRYGAPNAAAWSAWQRLLATAFRSSAQTGNYLAERPQFYTRGSPYRSEPVAPYDVRVLTEALDSLLRAAPALGGNDNYRYDVVNLTRQVLGQLAVPLVEQAREAYTRGDRPALAAVAQRVTRLLGDLDTLVGTREEFLLGRWIADARRWGRTDAERRLYEWNARNIVTLWGTACTEGQNDDLNLYAFKEWAGMFSSYFLPRWREFFARLDRALASGVPFDRVPFAADMCDWEQAWSRASTPFATQPRGDALRTARRLRAAYRDLLR